MSRTTLTPEAIDALDAEAKVGLLATLDGEGLPHLTLITTLSASGPDRLIWGQFCEGRSKDNIRRDPRAGFLVMNLSRQLWRGRARWTGEAREGADHERLNRLSLFRYNSYINIHTVHTMDLLGVSEREGLPLPGMLAGALPLAASGRLSSGSKRRRNNDEGPLNRWTVAHLGRVDTLKFLAYVDEEGHPAIIPAVPARPREASRVVIAPTVHARELRSIPEDATVAVFAMNLKMESVLLRGELRWTRQLGVPLGVVEVDWVYNSLPPLPGQIYPPRPGP